MQRSTRFYLIVGVSAIWVAAVVLSAVAALQSEPDMTVLTNLAMNAAGPATVLVALWPRTTHPTDAWEGGIEEGRRLEREAMDRHPRSGELRVCR